MWLLVLLITGLALGGCRDFTARTTGVPDRQTFIDAYVALREAGMDATSPQDFDQRKSAVLRRFALTDSAMVAFVRAHGDDAAYMEKVWEDVTARIQGPNAATPPSAGPGAPPKR
jgi:hypothetical protein